MAPRIAAFPVRHPSAALLLVQVLGILVDPLMEDTSAGRVLFGVIGLLVPMARGLVMIEEFSGVMYLALVVSRLNALSVTTRATR
jgi:hypothetical protein